MQAIHFTNSVVNTKHKKHNFILTDHLSDAIETGCTKCTDAQQKGTYRVIEHLIKNELDIWRELCAKYDPTGTWRKKYEDRAKANGIVIPE